MSKHFDLHHNIGVTAGLTSQTIGTDTTTEGAIVDTQYFRSVEFVAQSGTITDGAFAVEIWQSDDAAMADAVQVTGTELLGNADFADTDDDGVKRIGTLGKLRYQQLRVVSTGTTSGGVFSAVAIKVGPNTAPVAD